MRFLGWMIWLLLLEIISAHPPSVGLARLSLKHLAQKALTMYY